MTCYVLFMTKEKEVPMSSHKDRDRWTTLVVILGSGVMIALLTASLLFGQSQQWSVTYDGVDHLTDYGSSICYGMDGRIYIAGSSRSADTDEDLFVMSMNATGRINWTFTMTGGSISATSGDSSKDRAQEVCYGPDGNIYVVGKLAISDNDYAFTVISLTPDGEQRWVYNKSGTANGLDEARALVFDSDCNLYVAGWLTNATTSCDFTIVSLDRFGQERWVYQYNGSANGTDLGLDVVYGADDNIYACGYVEDTQTGKDWLLTSLTSSGQERWTRLDHNPGDDHCYSIAYGPDRIYLAGETYNPDNGSSDMTVKGYNSSGELTTGWVYTYDYAADYDCANTIAFGPDGNIYTAGWSAGTNSYDAIVISLDTTGRKRWVYRYDTIGTMHEAILSEVNFDETGNLYVGGYSSNFGTGCGCCVLASLDPKGTERWVITCCDSGYMAGYYEAIAIGADGNLYMVGAADPGDQVYDISVACVTDLATCVPQVGTLSGWSSLDADATAHAGFAMGLRTNPCTKKAVFDLTLPADAFVRISIYDGVGRMVDTPWAGMTSAGNHEVIWSRNAGPGIYFYDIESPWNAKSGKLVLLE